jgi:glutathione S-transferase
MHNPSCSSDTSTNSS